MTHALSPAALQEEEGDPFDDRPAQPRREAPQMERIQAR